MYQPGYQFTGRYELKEHLGTGGFGEVWQAYDHTIRKEVALKIVGGGAQMSRALVKACSDEYKATLDIHHTHLLTPNYFDIYQGKMYLVMPLCGGGALSSYLYKGTLAEKDVLRLIKELALALAYLHQAGLLHNDIKPDNILLSKPLAEGGRFLLTDFGISTRLRTSVRKSTGSDAKGMKGMTHAYSAPELFGSLPKQTPATDVFSFGVMLYECCVGDVPWMGAGGVMLNQGAVVPELPDTYASGLRNLVKACLSPSPAQRPSAEALSRLKVRTAAPSPKPQGEPRRTQKKERQTVKREEPKRKKEVKPQQEQVRGKSGPKKLKTLSIFLVLAIGLGIWGYFNYTGASGEDWVAFYKDGKYGFKDKDGKERISPVYDYADKFSEGRARVEKDWKYGYVDKEGKEVIPLVYDYARDFSEGRARVRKDGKYGFVDTNGKEVIPLVYDGAWSFSEGRAPVQKYGKWGFIDTNGKEVIPLVYEDAWSFSEGRAKVEKDGEEFYINKQGERVD